MFAHSESSAADDNTATAGHHESGSGMGRRGFIAASAAVAGTAAAASVLGVGERAGAASGLSKYVALPPRRLADTRPQYAFGFSRSGKVTTVKVAGRTVDGVTVPSNATAAVLTIVAISRVSGRNFVSAYPAGTARPNTSSVNTTYLNAVVPNLVTCGIGTNGSIQIYADQAADLVVDLAGVYVPSATGTEKEGRYQDVTPRRVLDTRNTPGKPGAGQTVRVDLTPLVAANVIAADAQAVSVNLTAASPTAKGYITAYPFGIDEPETSSLNVVQGENRAIGALVTLGRDSSNRLGFNLYTQSGSHLIVDVDGFMTGPSATTSSGGLFVAVPPQRLMDTRKGQRGKKRLWRGWTRSFDIPAAYRAEAGTVVMNVTATRTMARGWFAVNAAQTRIGTPAVSNLNVNGPGLTVANHVVSRASTAGVEVYADQGGDVIADMVGYYKSARAGTTAPVPPDPAPQSIAPPYWMVAPSIGRMNSGRSVINGTNAYGVVDSGKIWHWTGTGDVGNNRYNVATFGHRTDAGGPFYYVDRLQAGDRIYVTTADQRTYVYKYARREITSKSDAQILAATQRLAGESLSLIACTVGYDRSKAAYPNSWAPTSLEYRIVVTMSLEYWTDDIPLQ